MFNKTGLKSAIPRQESVPKPKYFSFWNVFSGSILLK